MLGKGLLFKNVRERSTAQNYRPVSKVFEKLVNNRIVDHLQNSGLFSDFQYGFRASQSTADLLTVVSDRSARAFNTSEATRAVAVNISKAFDRVFFFTNLILIEFQVRYLVLFILFLVIGGFGWFQMGSPTLFLLFINDLPNDDIRNIAIYADDTTVYSNCDHASDLWQQLEFAELESDL